MDRQEILNIVVKHLSANVDGVDPAHVDPGKSMADYDASSLDIVEVVSATMRELKISIPRTEFAGIQNINQLTDLLYRVGNSGA
jgi:polyketide biosynthesis acyl carrier protein